MSNPIQDVSYVHVIDTGQIAGRAGESQEVNDYLAMDGWILLEVTKTTVEGDNGPGSWAVYHLGWIGEGLADYPPA